MDNNNPTDPNAGQTPVADPNAGTPVADAPMGGSSYTPPVEPVAPVAEEAPVVPSDQPAGEQPATDAPTV